MDHLIDGCRFPSLPKAHPVSAYPGRYRGENRLDTELDLRIFLRWCADHDWPKTARGPWAVADITGERDTLSQRSARRARVAPSRGSSRLRPGRKRPIPEAVEQIDRARLQRDLITLANGTDLEDVCGAWCQTRMRLAPTSQLRLEAGQGGCPGP
jgi:hypothetical protein